MKRIALLCFLLLAGPQWAAAQSATDCKQWLLDYQQAMVRQVGAAKNGFVFVHMTVTTLPAKDSPYAKVSLPMHDLEVKMIAGDRYLVYESPHLALYRDGRESFTVLHPRKTIIRTPLAEAENDPQQAVLEQFPGARRQLLEQCTVQTCQPGKLDGKTVQIITLQASEEVRKTYGIAMVQYYVDLKGRRILKQEIVYVPGAAYERQVVVYHRVDPDYRHDKLSSASYVLTGKRLLDKYRHYTLE